MRQIIYTAFLCVLLIPAKAHCQTPAKTPIEFNDGIVDIIDSLGKQGTQWTDAFTQINNTTKNFTELAPVRKSMVVYLDKEVKNLKQMKNVGKGCEEFKTATVNYLLYEKKAITQGFVVMEKLNAKTAPEEFQKAVNILTEAAKDEPQEMEKFTNAQKAYAEKNNFTIQDQ
jgi:hypothetical protein